jgi:hypothetical protein
VQSKLFFRKYVAGFDLRLSLAERRRKLRRHKNLQLENLQQQELLSVDSTLKKES